MAEALEHVSRLWSEQLPGKAALPHAGLLTALGLTLGSYAEHRGQQNFSRYADAGFRVLLHQGTRCNHTRIHAHPEMLSSVSCSYSAIAELVIGLESAFMHAASAESSAPRPGMQMSDGAAMDDFDMDFDIGDGCTIVSRSHPSRVWQRMLL
jgi:hypothetical protein